MNRQFLYLIGEPGIGKSTLMAQLTSTMLAIEQVSPIRHILWLDGYQEPRFAELGARRANGFSGTDALPMGIQPRATEWIAQRPYRSILAEGDRLANDGFFAAVEAAGYKLTVVYLAGSVAAERRIQRGSRQNPAWVRGRITKTERLAIKWGALDLIVDGKDPATLAAELVLKLGVDPGAGLG